MLLLLAWGTSFTTMAQTDSKDARVLIKTTLGDITIKLYGDTPKHRDNFLKLAREGFYDGVLFHRVIDQFMIQTGDPDSKNAKPGQSLGSGDLGYQIDAEIICPRHFNRYGALAAARTGDEVNPERKSSASQFYIVTGHKFNAAQLDQMEKRMRQERERDIFNNLARDNRDSIMNMRRTGDREGLQALQDKLNMQARKDAAEQGDYFTAEQRKIYEEQGGAPHLDGAYTVFGEVVDGMDVVAKIEKAETDSMDRPKQDIKVISMKVLED